ncbi:DUF6635 family protein [Aliagarivorans taiwanensis]|uniref:DUF6635 family protein n=1 Tax=Aliagarivorans taiwanensis TaxID=561966 RepID=UPI000416A360|nr:DUF6635 family protein [Aliagarivorans taiwanensis]
MNEREYRLIQALNKGVDRYFEQAEGQTAGFVARHFRYPGNWQTNRRALGLDMLRAPLNLLWAPLYLFGRMLLWLARRKGWGRASRLLERLPGGLITQVQRYVAERFRHELLDSLRLDACLRDAICETLSEDESLDTERLSALQRARFEQLLEELLSDYAQVRTAMADIGNSLTSLVIGALAFKKYTPGGIALGLYLAGGVSQYWASQQFWAGPWLGELYYSVVPVSTSVGLQVGSVLATLCALAVFASFSGLILDPLQARLGLHQARLNKVLRHMRADFKQQRRSSYHAKEPYLARLLEFVDSIRSPLNHI